MSAGAEKRAFRRCFERVAEQYDRVRRGYPDELVELAVRRAGLGPGDSVLEIGAGTGKLTTALAARGLNVLAIEPGEAMIEVARRRVGPSVEFLRGGFEEVSLADGRYRAVFSATAFHWVDPRVGWRRAARVLAPGGQLTLLQHTGVRDPATSVDEEAMLGALAAIAPELAQELGELRPLDVLLGGALARRANISELWEWIGHHVDVADRSAAELFEDVQIDAVPVVFEQTAEQVNAHLRSTSLWARLGPERAARLEAENIRVVEQLGGIARATTLAVLATARRA